MTDMENRRVFGLTIKENAHLERRLALLREQHTPVAYVQSPFQDVSPKPKRSFVRCVLSYLTFQRRVSQRNVEEEDIYGKFIQEDVDDWVKIRIVTDEVVQEGALPTPRHVSM